MKLYRFVGCYNDVGNNLQTMTRPAIFSILALSFLSLEAYAQSKDSTWRKVPMREFYTRYSPIDYLRVLEEDFKDKQEVSVFTITPSPDNWIREEHIEWLMKFIYKTDSTKSIMSSVSSSVPADKYSSIGREAQNLIYCFKNKRNYPDFLTSFGAPDNVRARQLEDWWRKYKAWKP
jgi:hypothetical protein